MAFVAAVIAWRSHERQKNADLESKFWTRLIWALEQAGDEDVHNANMGMVVLNSLARESHLTAGNTALLAELNENVIARVQEGSFDLRLDQDRHENE